MDTDSPRILFYSHDAYGMGNIRRTLAICEHLTKTIPNVAILIITGSPIIHSLQMPERVDYVKLPCLTRDASESFSAKYWNMGLHELIPIRADLILSAVRNFRPNLVIVDKKPVGIKKEFFGALNWIKKHLPATRVILGLRDILDEPEMTIPVWEKNRYYDVIQNYYDGVWIFGDPIVFDAVKEYQMPAFMAEKVNFTGYLVKPHVGTERMQIRTELGLNGGVFSVVMAGGGGDGFPIMKTYVEAARFAGHQPHHLDSLLITGPEMPKAQREQVADWCSNDLPLRCTEFSDTIENMLVAADVVVSMGGYNSTCEVLAYRKKAVIIPRVKPVKEQYIRAKRLAALGVVNMIHPDELTPLTMQRAIEKTAKQNQMLAGLETKINLNGLQTVEQLTRAALM